MSSIRRFVLPCAFLLTATGGLPVLADVNPIQLIQEMAETEDMSTRRQKCSEILASNPRPYARSFCEGHEMIFLGQDAEAEIALGSALAQRPDFALAYMIYGDAYVALGKKDEAERYYRRAIEIQPERSDVRFALGQLLLERGQNEDPRHLTAALEVFRAMTEQNPSSPDGWSNMAYVLVQMDRLDEAEGIYQKAISKRPDDPTLYDNLASLYARRNQDAEAEQTWMKAIQVQPGYGEAIVELAALYGRTHRVAEAVSLLEEGRRTVIAPPWGPRLRRNLGFAYLALGSRERAQNRFGEAAASGNDALSFLGLGHLRMLAGEREGALQAFARGAALDSTLARPFLAAWRTELNEPAQSGEPSDLDRLFVALGAGDRTEVQASGAEASLPLALYVLEGWSFENADQVLQRIEAEEKGSVGAEYDSPPIPVKQVKAAYPESAQEVGLEGVVHVRMQIDEKGKVTDAQIDSTTAPPILNDAALAAAFRWSFQPAMRYGAPVRSSIVVPFRFSRKGS